MPPPGTAVSLAVTVVTIPHWLWVSFVALVCVGPVATILLWGLIWWRVERTIRLLPTLRFGQTLAALEPPTGRVCVVVPAHNESRVIAGLVASLRSETYADVRFVLALDRCTDDTASLARSAIGGDGRFEIVEIDACPDDWVGKVHAVHMGFTRSRGATDAEYLLFADADTLFSPGCIASALALMQHRKVDLLSLLSTLTYETWFERVAQPAATLELMRRYPPIRVNGLERPRAFANGQFLLFSRDAYRAIGGHESVKDSLFEDVALAGRIAFAHRKTGVFMADGLFRCRMYADWSQFRRGWKRIYSQAADSKARRLTVWSWHARWLGAVFPVWMLAAAPLGVMIAARDPARGWTVLILFAAGFIAWLGALTRISAMGRAPQWTSPLHIVGAWLVAGILAEAAMDIRLRRPTQWGGREYEMRTGKA